MKRTLHRRLTIGVAWAISLLLAPQGIAIDDYGWRCTNSNNQIHIRICGSAPAGAVSFNGGIDGNGYYQSGRVTTDQQAYCVEWTFPTTDFTAGSTHTARLRFCDNDCANILGETVVQFGPVGGGEDVHWFTGGTNYPGSTPLVLDCTPRMEPAPDNDPCRSGQAASIAFPATAMRGEDRTQNAVKQDPVTLGAGASFFEDPDRLPVPLPGRTFSTALAFGRYQSSGNPAVDPFYGGWTHNYNVRLIDLTAEVFITDWQGSRRTFVSTNGVYEGDGTSSLVKTNGHFVWTLPHGTRFVFNGNYGNRLTNITDRIGNSVLLKYSNRNVLTGALDNAGRKLFVSFAGRELRGVRS